MLIPPLFFISTAISTTTTTGPYALLFKLCQPCSSNLSLVSHWMTRSRRYVLVLAHHRPLLNMTFGVLEDVSCHRGVLTLVMRESRRGRGDLFAMARNFRRNGALARLKVRGGGLSTGRQEKALIGYRDPSTDVNYWRRWPQLWRPVESLPGMTCLAGPRLLSISTRRPPSR
jgi:hypothetical protein